MNLTIEINDGGVAAALNRLLAAGQNLNPILHALGARLESNVRRGFETGTDPYGRQWPALTSTHQWGATIRPTAGKTWQTKHGSVPSKLVFMIGGRLVFASQVTIPQREMFPTEGLPPDWEADSNDAISEVLRSTLQT